MKSITEVRKETGLNKGTIRNFITGRKSITIDNFKKLLDQTNQLRLEMMINEVRRNIKYKPQKKTK